MMTLAHRIALDPTIKQRAYFVKAAGCARFVWNLALEAWNAEYAAGGKPNTSIIKKEFNSHKYEAFPWMKEIHRDAHSQPFANLQRAWVGFFKKIGGRPKFRKKGRKDSFYIANDQMVVDNEGWRVRIPLIGWVRMREQLRFVGKIMSATVIRHAERWFISIRVEIEKPERVRTGSGTAGVDLGIKSAATIANEGGSQSIKSPRPIKTSLVSIRRFSRALSRRVIGGSRWKRMSKKLSKIYAKTKNIRHDFWHKITTRLCRENQAVGIETLNVSGMVRNKKLSGAIADVGFSMPKRQLGYKSILYSVLLVEVDRFFPSSKTCSNCGSVKESLSLSERVFRCDYCLCEIDRDLNAAINLRNIAKEKYPRREGNLKLGDSTACRVAGMNREARIGASQEIYFQDLAIEGLTT